MRSSHKYPKSTDQISGVCTVGTLNSSNNLGSTIEPGGNQRNYSQKNVYLVIEVHIKFLGFRCTKRSNRISETIIWENNHTLGKIT